MKNIKLMILFVMVALLLSGCGTGSDSAQTPVPSLPDISDTPTPDESHEPEPSGTQVPDITDIPVNDSSFTLYLSNSIIYKNDNEMAEYLTSLMKEKGFDIEVKFYKIDNRNREQSLAAWEEKIRMEIDRGGNLMFEVLSDIDDMDADGLLYYPDDQADSPQIEVGGKKRLSFTGVYVRKTLEEDYGAPIDSIDEYRSFLDWVALKAPELTPCMIKLSSGAESYTPISLFAQENGFIRIDRAIGELGEGNMSFYMELSDIGTSGEILPVIYEAANLPFFEEMDRVLTEWDEKEYIDVKDRYGEFDSDKYASLILNMRDTSEYYPYDYSERRFNLVDASEFNLHVFMGETGHLNNPLASSHNPSSHFAISSKSPSPELMKDFIEWIYSTIDNYMWFMCGKEGIDYSIEDGRVVSIENDMGIEYAQWYKHNIFIETEADLVMSHFPSNWKQVNSDFQDINHTSILKVIGQDNLGFDYDKKVYETVFEKELLNAYWKEISPLYELYFTDLNLGKRTYTIDDLRNDIMNSETAARKKEAYETLIKAVCGVE